MVTTLTFLLSSLYQQTGYSRGCSGATAQARQQAVTHLPRSQPGALPWREAGTLAPSSKKGAGETILTH